MSSMPNGALRDSGIVTRGWEGEQRCCVADILLVMEFRLSLCLRVVVVIAVGLAVRCGSERAPVQPRQDEPSGASIAFEFDPEVSIEDRDLVEETIVDSRRFYANEIGTDLKLDVTVKVLAEDGGPYLGLSYGRVVWIFTGGENWPLGSSLDEVIAKEQLIAHELFHTFQWDLMYTDDAIPSDSAWWISEGSAEYASARYVAARYNVDWPFILLGYVVSTESGLPSLSSNSRDVQYFDALYPKAFLAVESLMRDRPLKDLATYFEATGRMDWEEAFLRVFEIAPSTFVSEFESSSFQ